MNITNKFALSTAANAVALTNDAVVATGRAGITWVGLSPDLTVSPTTTGNIAAGDGGMLVSSSSVKQVGRVMSAFFEIKVEHAFVAAVDNLIKIPVEYLNLNVANIIAANIKGLIDETTAGVVTAFSAPTTIVTFVSKPQHCISVAMPTAAADTIEGKTIVLEVLYRQ